MVRKLPDSQEERKAVHSAINKLAGAYQSEYGDAIVGWRSFVGDEYGDASYTFSFEDSEQRKDVEHAEIRLTNLVEICKEYGFSVEDLAYNAVLRRDHERDFAHDPQYVPVLRLSVRYEYEEFL